MAGGLWPGVRHSTSSFPGSRWHPLNMRPFCQRALTYTLCIPFVPMMRIKERSIWIDCFSPARTQAQKVARHNQIKSRPTEMPTSHCGNKNLLCA